MFPTLVESLYAAILARGTRSVPTYAEVQREARRIAALRDGALLGTF